MMSSAKQHATKLLFDIYCDMFRVMSLLPIEGVRK